jgi:hypothetical protein
MQGWPNLRSVWRWSFQRPITLACIFSGLLGVPVTAQQGGLLLPQEQADCLHENGAQYLALPDEPLFVYPGYCTEGLFSPDTAQLAQDSQRASFTIPKVHLPDGREVGGDLRATLLILTRAQMECLSRQYDAVMQPVAEITSGEHVIPFVELRFDGCS